MLRKLANIGGGDCFGVGEGNGRDVGADSISARAAFPPTAGRGRPALQGLPIDPVGGDILIAPHWLRIIVVMSTRKNRQRVIFPVARIGVAGGVNF